MKNTLNYHYESIRFINNACGCFVFMWCRAGVETIQIETLGM